MSFWCHDSTTLYCFFAHLNFEITLTAKAWPNFFGLFSILIWCTDDINTTENSNQWCHLICDFSTVVHFLMLAVHRSSNELKTSHRTIFSLLIFDYWLKALHITTQMFNIWSDNDPNIAEWSDGSPTTDAPYAQYPWAVCVSDVAPRHVCTTPSTLDPGTTALEGATPVPFLQTQPGRSNWGDPGDNRQPGGACHRALQKQGALFRGQVHRPEGHFE